MSLVPLLAVAKPMESIVGDILFQYFDILFHLLIFCHVLKSINHFKLYFLETCDSPGIQIMCKLLPIPMVLFTLTLTLTVISTVYLSLASVATNLNFSWVGMDLQMCWPSYLKASSNVRTLNKFKIF